MGKDILNVFTPQVYHSFDKKRKRVNEMKNKKVSDYACEVAEVTSQIGLLENYLSCLALQGSQKNHELVLFSLFHEKGLTNAMDSLKVMGEKIQSIADELIDCEAEVVRSEAYGITHS